MRWEAMTRRRRGYTNHLLELSQRYPKRYILIPIVDSKSPFIISRLSSVHLRFQNIVLPESSVTRCPWEPLNLVREMPPSPPHLHLCHQVQHTYTAHISPRRPAPTRHSDQRHPNEQILSRCESSQLFHRSNLDA